MPGLIPARAGNTCQCTSSFVTAWAHPRSRGEHCGDTLSAPPPPGSSPLARGTLTVKVIDGAAAGLIPARAGNTSAEPFAADWRWAHPRSRGEHRVQSLEKISDQGSSPLARGTRGNKARQEAAPGLIPARAGNTRRNRRAWPNGSAHPRSRGEHPRAFSTQRPFSGSSPLARGTRDKFRDSTGTFGLIPARAGNTCQNFTGAGVARAHPRSRGEHTC